MPLGTPVEPDVCITYASDNGWMRGSGASAIDWLARSRDSQVATRTPRTLTEPTSASRATITTGRGTSGVAVGAGSVWVGNQVDNTLLRIDTESRQVQKTIELGAQPLDIAVNAGAVWVLSATAGSVLRVDPIRNQVVARIRLEQPAP